MNCKKVAVFISGRGTNLQAIIDARRSNFLPIEIVLVVTNNKDAGGVRIAQSANIPIFYLEEENKTREEYDEILATNCKKCQVDLIILAGWMRILSKVLINSNINKIINIHPALPGQYPGTNAIKRAYVDAQEGKIKATGVMVHVVVEEVDAGEVIDFVQVPIHPGDRFDILSQQYYNDSSLWWIISSANSGLPQNSYYIPEGTQIRIPQNISGVISNFNSLNGR